MVRCNAVLSASLFHAGDTDARLHYGQMPPLIPKETMEVDDWIPFVRWEDTFCDPQYRRKDLGVYRFFPKFQTTESTTNSHRCENIGHDAFILMAQCCLFSQMSLSAQKNNYLRRGDATSRVLLFPLMRLHPTYLSAPVVWVHSLMSLRQGGVVEGGVGESILSLLGIATHPLLASSGSNLARGSLTMSSETRLDKNPRGTHVVKVTHRLPARKLRNIPGGQQVGFRSYRVFRKPARNHPSIPVTGGMAPEREAAMINYFSS